MNIELNNELISLTDEFKFCVGALCKKHDISPEIILLRIINDFISLIIDAVDSIKGFKYNNIDEAILEILCRFDENIIPKESKERFKKQDEEDLEKIGIVLKFMSRFITEQDRWHKYEVYLKIEEDGSISSYGECLVKHETGGIKYL